MSICSKVYYVDHKITLIKPTFVKDFKMWKDLEFWERAFVYEYLKRFKEQQVKDVILEGYSTLKINDMGRYGIDEILFCSLMSAFVYNMMNWGVKPSDALLFIDIASTDVRLQTQKIRSLHQQVKTKRFS
eukprot:TRINITY_DN3753_c0_g1_i1.p1 TRINITY_DN3753_c0_g1~~TRINITY_DN3753_c0_g1_i1.p1  ORF type:complete len:130 (+),score=16.04 TRINITY_DN3753_c0_g1_i1:93-482(+)